jgi:hypothetical protein
VSVRVKRCAADQGGFQLERQVQNVQDFDGFSDDFGADAITGENCDFHENFLWIFLVRYIV